MAKIIPLIKVITQSALPLTPLMIKTLRLACKMQSNNESFGQIEIKGSFTALVKRQFIDCKNINIFGELQVCWYVTEAGKNALIKIGIKDKC